MPGTVRRMLKDSSRFLLSGVRAALGESIDSTRDTLDAWRRGERELVQEPFALARLLSDAMTEVTVTAAQLGIDLLSDTPNPMTDLPMDGKRVKAALEAILHAAMKEFGQDTTVRVRLDLVDGRPTIEVSAERAAARERLQARLVDKEQDLILAAEIIVAHGGTLAVAGDDERAALVARF